MNIPKKQQLHKQIVLFIILFFSINVVNLYSQDSQLSFTPSPGEYSHTIHVQFEYDTKKPPQYRFAGSSNETWITYKYPLRLTALPGEERVFTIQVRYHENSGETIKNYNYKVDKKAPKPPEIEIINQEGQRAIDFVKKEDTTHIKYWISSFKKNHFQTSNGENPLISSSETIKAYATDTAGNQSEVVTKRIYSDSPCTSPRDIMLASPVEGTFANPQKLAIPNAHCFEWIRYSTNGSSPQTNGKSYEKPILINETGIIQLRIQAKLYNSTKVIEKRLKYTVNESQSPALKALSVIEMDSTLTANRKLPVPLVEEGVQLFYSLNDNPVTTDHPSLIKPLQFDAAEGMKNYIPYRIGAYIQADSKMVQYRFLYFIDNRIPPNPAIHITDPLPFRSEIDVELVADKDASIYYTIDGSTPDRFSPRYTEKLNIESSKGSKLGVIPLQAISRYPNGNTSEVVRKLLPYDREVPASPNFEILRKDNDGATIQVSHPDPDAQIVYAIGYGETPLLQVNKDSPSLPKRFRIDFPYGYQGRAFLRFAARDTAGNISSATSTARVDVDIIPPNPPTIRLEENSILIKSDSNVYYKIEESQKEFTKYSGPIEIEVEDGNKKEYHISAYSIDDSENRSEKVEERFVIDRREALPPQVISSVTTTINNKPFFFFFISLFSDSLVYYKLYRLLEDEALPEAAQDVTPGFDDSQYTKAINLSGSEGREIKYILKARTYIPSSDRWSSVATTSFTIDRKPPIVPDFASIMDSTLFSKPVMIKKPVTTNGPEIWAYAVEHTNEQKGSRTSSDRGTDM